MMSVVISPVTPTTTPMMAIMTPAMMGAAEELDLHSEERFSSASMITQYNVL